MRSLLFILLNCAAILFAVSSTLSVGLRSTLREIIRPLRRMMSLGVLANFMLVPILAYAVAHLLSLDRQYEIGLILVASAAGAPLSIKLTQIAGGNLAYSAGLLVLLLVVTIAYMPLVLPYLIPDAQVRAGAIAKPLVLSMLLPLGIGDNTQSGLARVLRRSRTEAMSSAQNPTRQRIPCPKPMFL